jgi:hypothetical protein
MSLKSLVRKCLGQDDEDLTLLIATEIASNFDDFINSEELMTETLSSYLSCPADEANALCWHLYETIVENKNLLKASLYNWDNDTEDEVAEDDLDGDKEACQMCERSMPLTFHHLFPKKIHRRLQERTYKGHSESKGIPKEDLRTSGIMICRPCHSALHRNYDHDHLAKQLSSLEAILDDKKMKDWISFAAKQRHCDPKHGVLGLQYRR